MVSLVGVISIRRRYWQCRCGEPGAYEVDEVLGIESRFSRCVQKHTCRLAADTSFVKTSDHLKEMLKVSLCPETIRMLVEGHGKAMASFQLDDSTTDEAFQKAKGEVEFAIDAGKVNTREEGWKDLKIGVISKREPCEGVSGPSWEDQRLQTATFVIAFAMIATSKIFRETWKSRFHRLGVQSFGAIHVLGDGASWVWKSANRALTGCEQTLDIYHASERIAKCAKAIFGEETAETTKQFERGRGMLIEKGWLGVCEWVTELLSVSESEERERRREATDRMIGYFSKHMNRLNYSERLSSGRAIGSGAVEGQAKTLGLRLKSRGARWSRENVRPMASLVCVRNSPQWEAYWGIAA
jgi:hypothetical protein